jgi:hypothetical protein
LYHLAALCGPVNSCRGLTLIIPHAHFSFVSVP